MKYTPLIAAFTLFEVCLPFYTTGHIIAIVVMALATFLVAKNERYI